MTKFKSFSFKGQSVSYKATVKSIGNRHHAVIRDNNDNTSQLLLTIGKYNTVHSYITDTTPQVDTQSIVDILISKLK